MFASSRILFSCNDILRTLGPIGKEILRKKWHKLSETESVYQVNGFYREYFKRLLMETLEEIGIKNWDEVGNITERSARIVISSL